MGLFSKIIPKRKWVDVHGTLYRQLRDYRAAWFTEFTKHVSLMNVGLTIRQITPDIESAIASLQWAVAATRIREGGYVKLQDYTFFTKLLYIALTGRKADSIMDDFAMELLQVNDPKEAMNKWGEKMVPLVSGSARNPKLAEILSQWSSAIITQTMIMTCEACYDRKSAEAVRNELK